MELNNYAISNGTYNDLPTSVTSNTFIVNLIDGLSLTKSADKTNWVNGSLEYTLVLKNDTSVAYVNPVISDTLDITYVTFVSGSVLVNGEVLDSSKYTYESGTGLLTINLDTVAENSETTIKFSVNKKS